MPPFENLMTSHQRLFAVILLCVAATFVGQGCTTQRAVNVQLDAEMQTSDGPVSVWVAPVYTGLADDAPGEHLFDANVRNGEIFAMNFAALEKRLSHVAAYSFADEDTIKPVGTRVARLGSFAHEPSRPDEPYRARFRERASGDELRLVYVDRACTIQSSRRLDSGEMVYTSVELPGKGLHWIRVQQPAGGVQVIAAAGPVEDIVYTVMPRVN